MVPSTGRNKVHQEYAENASGCVVLKAYCGLAIHPLSRRALGRFRYHLFRLVSDFARAEKMQLRAVLGPAQDFVRRGVSTRPGRAGRVRPSDGGIRGGLSAAFKASTRRGRERAGPPQRARSEAEKNRAPVRPEVWRRGNIDCRGTS